MRLAFWAAALVAIPAAAHADTHVDDFEDGSNESGWAFIRGGDIIEADGGNPGGWLHQPTFDTFAPILDVPFGADTPFHGDYRARMVSRISLDARTDGMNFGDGTGFEMSLLLRDTNGTPTDFDDDDYVYLVGPNVPLVGEGWVHYDFEIPSLEDELPDGWRGGYSGDCENFRPGVGWTDVLTSVDRVEIWWMNPCFFAAFQQWDVGADNLAIEDEGGSTPVAGRTWSGIKSFYR